MRTFGDYLEAIDAEINYRDSGVKKAWEEFLKFVYTVGTAHPKDTIKEAGDRAVKVRTPFEKQFWGAQDVLVKLNDDARNKFKMNSNALKLLQKLNKLVDYDIKYSIQRHVDQAIINSYNIKW